MKNHGSRAAVQSGPAAPELAADANDCIMVRSSTDRPNTRLWRAISATPMASSPRIFIAGCNWAVSHATSNQLGSAMPRPTEGPIREPAMRVSPQADASCRRARGRQGRCAPLTRWVPKTGPILDRRCARRCSERAAGAEEWLRRGQTKELEKEEMKKNENRS